jgi:hypothetical protein
MDEALELADYLPRSFRSTSEQEYVDFLWQAFESNYENSRYQFAFLSYHMLVMSFIYFEIWQIKANLPNEFRTAMVAFNKDVEKNLLNATSPFSMHAVNESTALRFLKIIGCDNAKIGTYARLVKIRNESAHPNGIIQLNSIDSIDQSLNEAMRVVREIQSHSRPVVEACYRNFLLSNLDAEEWEYVDAADQIQEALVYANYFSSKDIAICAEFDLQSLDLDAGVDLSAVEELHTNLLQLNEEVAV